MNTLRNIRWTLKDPTFWVYRKKTVSKLDGFGKCVLKREIMWLEIVTDLWIARVVMKGVSMKESFN